MTTFEKVQALFAEQFECDPATITLDTDMVEDLGADSANVMVLIMELEDNFGIMVDDDAIMTLKTVEDVVKYIEAKV